MNPLGASSTIEVAGGGTLSNDFNTIPVNNIDSIIASNNVHPSQIGSGMTRGAQQTNNTDGSYMLTGVNADTGELGIFFYNPDGTLQAKYLGVTDFKYRDDSTNYYQSGKLPDGSYDLAIANSGNEVADAF